MPLTERVLWPLLRDRRLEGLKFRRQVPLAGYVVDFACFSARLVVEADGPFHDPAADAERDAALRSQGFPVLRFRNEDIDRNPGPVLSAIRQAAQREATAPSSDPAIAGPPSPTEGRRTNRNTPSRPHVG
jgi:very-short-patch-repair endonuclease